MTSSYARFLTAWTFAGAMLSSTGAQAAQSQVDTKGMTIVSMGAATEGTVFFNIAEYPAQDATRGCAFGLYYVKIDTPGGRGVYAALLQAKAAGKQLVRLEWDRINGPYGNVCYVSLVILKD